MDKILIIDFGSQVTQLIARRIREFNTYSEVKNYHDINLEFVKKYKPKGIVLSGGPSSVYEKNAPSLDKKILELGIPVFGICYGQQVICNVLDGKVDPSNEREYGKAFIEITKNSPLFDGVGAEDETGRRTSQVWMSHGDVVTKIPSRFDIIAKTYSAPFAAIANEKDKIYAVQYHPEVVHTLEGDKMLENFVKKICNCSGDWTMTSFKKDSIEKIKATVGQKRVICGLSGGVDSSVVAALISEAIGEQLTCIFVDTGLLRKDEGKQIEKTFTENFKVQLIYVDAQDLFLTKLCGISDPEQKRKIIGKTFIEVFDNEAKNIEDAEFLAQGTLYPDVIESSHPTGGASQTIKSHHNVGGLPKNMKLKLLEPVRDLFKDEVRALGRELGLPEEIVGRHPFPGPGLAIRIPGEITKEKIKILQNADAIYIDEIKKAGLYDKIWQAFSVLLPVKTVGVMGDCRTYEYVLALRAVTSTDGMTADVYPFETHFLTKVTNRIIGEVKGINRVVYDCTSKAPGTIEWE